MEDTLTFFQQLEKGFRVYQSLSDVHYEYNERRLVFQHGKMTLYHYESKQKKIHRTPLLVVFATVNRPEILDLFPNESFIGGLLENGMDVYFLDWGYPDKEDAHVSFDDYVTLYLHKAIQFIKQKKEKKSVDLLGVCQGGLISLCYAALFPDIKNLVLISTPIDFNTKDNVVAQLLKKIEIKNIIGENGNVPGSWLTQFFIYMRPFELIGKKYLGFVNNLEDQERTNKFLRVEKWLNDAPDQTGASFTTLINDLYHDNGLIKGQFKVDGKRIDLRKLSLPILNIMASEDEIVPMSATRCLKKYINSKKYTERIFKSGHIGIYISDKVGKRLPKSIARWLK